MGILPDVLAPGLAAVFCGTAASRVSAAVGAYYAGPGNAFWPTLYATGLTPRPLAPQEFRRLPTFGLGLTDLNQRESGADSDLPPGGFDVAGFRTRIEAHAPRIVAFTSKRAAQEALGGPVDYGWQATRIGGSRVFVLPSPSGRARRWWDASWWHALAEAVRADSFPFG
jgi:TDG/mug DNA glycosylase family protein